MNTIQFINTSMWYGEVIALNEVDFTVKPGITGLVGSNGAGKTTAIRLCASLLKPTLGEVLINGETIWQNYEYMKNMGYSPEIDRQFSFLTGRDFLKWSGRLQSIPSTKLKKRVDEVIKQVSMTHAADRPISGYSRGMRQRIKVGQALLHNPEVLLFDEPLSGTDPIGRRLIIEILKDLANDHNATIIVSSHVLHELERVSDKVLVLDSGKLVAEGTISDVRKALSRIPQKIRIRTSNPVLTAELIIEDVKGVKIVDNENLIVEVSNRLDFMESFQQKIKFAYVTVYEVTVLDQDLTSVFNLITKKS